MAIIRKTDLQRHIQELDDRYLKLRKAVVGDDPNPNVFEQYSVSPDDYKEHFTEVDVASVEYALHDFKGVLNQLGKIKSGTLTSRVAKGSGQGVTAAGAGVARRRNGDAGRWMRLLATR